MQVIDNYLQCTAELSAALLEQSTLVEDYNAVLSDLDHFLELDELTEDDTKKLTAFRVATLRNRRVSKDRVRVIDQVLVKQIEGRTTQDRYEHAVRRLAERVYTPRKITLKEVLS